MPRPRLRALVLANQRLAAGVLELSCAIISLAVGAQKALSERALPSNRSGELMASALIADYLLINPKCCLFAFSNDKVSVHKFTLTCPVITGMLVNHYLQIYLFSIIFHNGNTKRYVSRKFRLCLLFVGNPKWTRVCSDLTTVFKIVFRENVAYFKTPGKERIDPQSTWSKR